MISCSEVEAIFRQRPFAWRLISLPPPTCHHKTSKRTRKEQPKLISPSRPGLACNLIRKRLGLTPAQTVSLLSFFLPFFLSFKNNENRILPGTQLGTQSWVTMARNLLTLLIRDRNESRFKKNAGFKPPLQRNKSTIKV